MPRFVVLLHETPPGYPRGAHLDLMLEQGGVLRTWALDKPPLPGEIVSAERLPDHRLEYLDYEGAVSRERGVVSRVDSGRYEVLQETSTTLAVRLAGQKIHGVLTLIAEDEALHRWRVSLSAD
jgi:DNA polymerase ligase (LigD)-like protein